MSAPSPSPGLPWSVLVLGTLCGLLFWGLFVALVWFAVVGPAPSGRAALSAPASAETFLKTGLDVSAPFCRTAGLSSLCAVRHSVSAVFLCPDSATRCQFAGVGVVGGDKIPARAGKSATGSHKPERTPAPVLALSLQNCVMKKKIKGAARPGKTAAPRAKASGMVKVKVALSDWAGAQLIQDYQLGLSTVALDVACAALRDGVSAFAVADSPRLAEAERAARRQTINEHSMELPAGLASDLAAMGKRELGFSLGATLSYLLSADALREPSTFPDDDGAGDEWKTEGRAEA